MIYSSIWKGMMDNMKTLDQYIKEQLVDEEFKEEWEKSQSELAVVLTIVDDRISESST